MIPSKHPKKTHSIFNIKPLVWAEHGDTHIAHFLGITLAVHLDKDGTYTASLSGVHDKRPEYEKSFETLDWAKRYAERTMLRTELNRVLEQDTLSSIWDWFGIAKREPTRADLIKQIKYHVEEFTETMQACNVPADRLVDLHTIQDDLEILASDDDYKEQYLTMIDKTALLDGLCDQIVTAIGVAKYAGMDIFSALAEVNRSNYTKFAGNAQDGYKPYIREDGKIGKNPDTYRPPHLEPFTGE